MKVRASRRLLQTINALEEELAIVNDILMHQKKVLQAFREYLEPSLRGPAPLLSCGLN